MFVLHVCVVLQSNVHHFDDWNYPKFIYKSKYTYIIVKSCLLEKANVSEEPLCPHDTPTFLHVCI